MKKMKKTSITLAALCVAGATFGQGSLTPPGAPSPTMKTLDELDALIIAVSNAVDQIQDETRIDLATVAGDSDYHHVITQPGSYYLSGNLEVTKASGISINTPGVTLDLNGFQISRTSGTGGYGIYIDSGANYPTIRNGSIAGFEYGMQSLEEGGVFKNLTASECTSYGIFGAGSSSRLIDCQALNNLGSGIHTGKGSSLSGCTASGNQGNYGIVAGDGSSLSGCIASGNQGSYGICAINSILSGCAASYNQSKYGIYASIGSSLSGCTAFRNIGSGSESYGIYVDYGSLVENCTASYNGNTNSPGTFAQGEGIYADNGSTIRGCVSKDNDGDGIQVDNDCLVTGNSCDGNGSNSDGAGIHARFGDNRIENNNVTDNTRGIGVDSSGNFIVCNTSSGNDSNWEIAAGNACLVVYRTYGAAISGNDGGTAPGSTDPNANFTY